MDGSRYFPDGLGSDLSFHMELGENSNIKQEMDNISISLILLIASAVKFEVELNSSASIKKNGHYFESYLN